MRVLAALALVLFAFRADGSAAPAYAGLMLQQALQELQAQGLPVVFTTRLVRPEMRVLSEPAAIEPRRILDEILHPNGLEAREAAGGRIVILPHWAHSGVVGQHPGDGRREHRRATARGGRRPCPGERAERRHRGRRTFPEPRGRSRRLYPGGPPAGFRGAEESGAAHRR